MRLLAEVLEHAEGRSLCSVDRQQSRLFQRADGSTPAWLALEYMAQGAAVHGALLARESGQNFLAGATGPPLLLGCRRLQLHLDSFPAEQRLWVRAQNQRIGRDLVSVDCAILDAEAGASGDPLAEGRLNIHVEGLRTN